MKTLSKILGQQFQVWVQKDKDSEWQPSTSIGNDKEAMKRTGEKIKEVEGYHKVKVEPLSYRADEHCVESSVKNFPVLSKILVKAEAAPAAPIEEKKSEAGTYLEYKAAAEALLGKAWESKIKKIEKYIDDEIAMNRFRFGGDSTTDDKVVDQEIGAFNISEVYKKQDGTHGWEEAPAEFLALCDQFPELVEWVNKKALYSGGATASGMLPYSAANQPKGTVALMFQGQNDVEIQVNIKDMAKLVGMTKQLDAFKAFIQNHGDQLGIYNYDGKSEEPYTEVLDYSVVCFYVKYADFKKEVLRVAKKNKADMDDIKKKLEDILDGEYVTASVSNVTSAAKGPNDLIEISLYKSTQKDSIEHGVDPNSPYTSNDLDKPSKKFKTWEEMLGYLHNNYGLSKNMKDYTAFEDGRLIFQRSEDADGNALNEEQVKVANEKGALYLADYDIYVTYVTIQTPSQNDLEAEGFASY